MTISLIFTEATPVLETDSILESSLIECVKNASVGWDGIVPPLIQFCFVLLETTVNKSGFF
jgi:hypothetical protein